MFSFLSSKKSPATKPTVDTCDRRNTADIWQTKGEEPARDCILTSGELGGSARDNTDIFRK